tara:strand:+ start:421 stop:1386 length:966 start_codon:yes stop_codon:yes gene_type:complete
MKCNKIVQDAIAKLVVSRDWPELSSSEIASEIKELENIIPEGSYIKTKNFNKYKPKISEEASGLLLARQKIAEQVPGRTAMVNFFRDYRKYRDGELPEEMLKNRYSIDASENITDYATDSASDVSLQDIEWAHMEASVILDKDLYVTKSVHHESKGLVSTFAVDPKHLVSFNSNFDKTPSIYKVPKGSRVSFVDIAKVGPYESTDSISEEVVLDNIILQNIPRGDMLKLDKLKSKLKSKWYRLKLRSEGMSRSDIEEKIAENLKEKQTYISKALDTGSSEAEASLDYELNIEDTRYKALFTLLGFGFFNSTISPNEATKEN